MSNGILSFAGSARRDSLNRRLAVAAADAARAAGATVTLLELRDYPLPLYDGDLEASGLPSNLEPLARIFREHRGLIIAAPEYNSGYTPLMKNTLDWLSRVPASTATPPVLRGKSAILLGASPGALGGMRGLYQLRDVLQNMGVSVLPDPYLVAVGAAHQAFNQAGQLTQERPLAAVTAAAVELVKEVSR